MSNKRSHSEAFSYEDDQWIFDPQLDATILASRQEEEEQRGGSLLEFTLAPIGPCRRWQNVLQKQRYQAWLQQSRDATPRDDLGHEVTQALRRALLRQIDTDPTLTPHSTLHFTMQSGAFDHAFQSATFRVHEVHEESERLSTYLQTLAQNLNSNQAFTPDDTFDVETTFICTPGPRQTLPQAIIKSSVIRIKNKDALCCAHTIVTMRARADEQAGEFPPVGYQTLKKDRPTQERQAKELQRLAGVPEGACGIPELTRFQATLPGYQIKVMSIDTPHMIVFKEETASNKKILLIQEDGHCNGCNSFAGFLSKSYYCHECDRGYNDNTFSAHPCNGRFCTACFQRECPDFLAAKRTLPPGKYPTLTTPCHLCHRHFFGDTCLAHHYGGKPSLCQTTKRCPDCQKTYEIKYKQGRPSGPRHKCGWGPCPICDQRVDLATHQCYIQPIDPDDDLPKTKRVPATIAGTHAVVGEPDDDGYVEVERESPLLVFADYEAITDAEVLQTAILIGYETVESKDTVLLYGQDCTARFIEVIDELAVDGEGDDRRVIVLFHNLKGYDGMFLLHHHYRVHREVTDQITVGTKILCFTSDHLTFKDSLCFLPFPLSAFPATFGLTELRKGFFPHLFNTLDNQDYEGPMPDARFYDPDGVSAKNKADFERWYAEQVRDDVVFHLQRDMASYCESDVKLLKAGCQTFQEEFEAKAEFNPFVKCVTIASACNRFWRKKLLPVRTIASEPCRAWKGARPNQSVKALQWLAWQEHRLRVETPSTSTAP